MTSIDYTPTSKELDKLIDDEKKNIKVNAITCACFAFAAGGELTLSLFHPEISNFIVTGGFAIFSGINAKWMYDHYTKEQNFKEMKNKTKTK